MRQKQKRHPTKDNFRQFVIDEAHRNAIHDRGNKPVQMYELAHGVIVVSQASNYFNVYVNTNQWSLGAFKHAKSTSRDGRKRIDGSDLLAPARNNGPERIAAALKNHLTSRQLCTWHDEPQYFNF